MNKLFLVVNPKSGVGKIKNELLGVVNTFNRAGFSVTVHITKSRGDATDVVKELGKDYSHIVCCGGDGTLNEVITGVRQNGNAYKIGYIPSGTLNEWSAGLKISKNIKKAADDVLAGREVQLDIGQFGDKYFVYTASFGAFTKASYSAPQNVKNVLGQMAYVLEGIKSIGDIKPVHLKLTTYEGEVFEGDYLLGAVANAMSVGGIIKLSNAGVALNDGLFEVVLIENPDNISDLNEILDAIVRKDFNRKCIKLFKTAGLIVESRKKVDWTLDGEHGVLDRKTEIKNLRNAISFIIP